jgi:hypothetical protein
MEQEPELNTAKEQFMEEVHNANDEVNQIKEEAAALKRRIIAAEILKRRLRDRKRDYRYDIAEQDVLQQYFVDSKDLPSVFITKHVCSSYQPKRNRRYQR